MDADLDFCLKRFADEQMAASMKYIAQLERNLERKRAETVETPQQGESLTMSEQENTLIKQFTEDLQENSILINRTRHTIEDEFQKTLRAIKIDIDTVVQVTTIRNDNREYNEEIRTASNKIRQQIARIDSEMTQLFNLIDYSKSSDNLLSITTWFQQHYGYVKDVNRMIGKSNSSNDLLVSFESSPLMQCVLQRVSLWNCRQKIIDKFSYQMDEISTSTNKHLIDPLYRMTDKFSAFKFIRRYIDHRQEERHRQEEHQIFKMQQELEEQYVEQQTRATELVSALGQLTGSSVSDFQLNKKLRKIFQESDISEQLVPALIDRKEEATDEDLSLIMRLDADYNKWISNGNSAHQRFCLALSKIMQIPADSLRIERVEEGTVIVLIVIHPPYGQHIIKQLLLGDRNDSQSAFRLRAIQKCCAKFESRLCSIVFGTYTLPIEKNLMDLKEKKMFINHHGSTKNGDFLNSSILENDPSECPQGWKRFSIRGIDNDDVFNAKWGSWRIAYHGTKGSYAPFVLTSGLRVSTQRYDIPGNHQAIYLSPSMEYIAHPRHTYLWKTPLNDGQTYRYYQLIFQCRVNPNVVGDLAPETLLFNGQKTKIQIDQNYDNEELEWIIPNHKTSQECVRDNIVCYGVMMRVIDGEPKDHFNLDWWTHSHCNEY